MYRLYCMAVLAAVAGPAYAGADDFGRVVSFGDSLSDNGNLSAALGPFSGVAFGPENFFGRFSNGPTFAELLAGGANLATGESAQQRFFGLGFILNPAPVEGSVNLAIGGAVTNDNAIPTIDLLGTGLDPIPSVEDQITAFRNAGGRFGTGDLVTILAGANDIFNAFNQNPNLAIPAAEQAAAAQIRNVDALVDAPLGARTVVVANLPNLGVIPKFNGSVQTVQQGTDATNTFNDQFDAGVERIAVENPQANLVQADLRGALDVIIASPEAFGFVNVTDACVGNAACGDINTFLFFDEVHPTAAGHALLAQFIDELLSTDEHGIVVAALGEFAVSTRLEASDLIFRRGVSVAYGETPSGIYAEIIGQIGSGSSGGGFTDYDYQLAGVRAGFDVARGAFTFGGALAYLDGEINATRLNSDTNTAQADVYAIYNFAPFFIGAEGGLSGRAARRGPAGAGVAAAHVRGDPAAGRARPPTTPPAQPRCRPPTCGSSRPRRTPTSPGSSAPPARPPPRTGLPRCPSPSRAARGWSPRTTSTPCAPPGAAASCGCCRRPTPTCRAATGSCSCPIRPTASRSGRRWGRPGVVVSGVDVVGVWRPTQKARRLEVAVTPFRPFGARASGRR